MFSLTGKQLAVVFVALISACFAGFVSWAKLTKPLDNWYYDSLSRFHLSSPANDVVIVAIDETSLQSMGRWPWPRDYHADLVERLIAADAQAIVFDVIFSEYQQNEAGGLSAADQRFIANVERAANVVFPVYFEHLGVGGPLFEVLPYEQLSQLAMGLGHAHVDFDTDAVARGVYLKEGVGNAYWPHLSLTLASTLDELDQELLISLQQTNNDDLQLESVDNVVRERYTLIRFVGGDSAINRVSYQDVLAGRVPDDVFTGKRVFVGATAVGLGDYISTPVGLLPGVEWNANIYQALRDSAFIQPLSESLAIVLVVFSCFVICLLMGRLSPASFFLFTALICLALFVASGVLYRFVDFWASPFALIAGVFLFYPLWSWRKIELALAYLRDELSVLQLGSKAPQFDIDSMCRTLEQLESMRSIDSWSLQATGGAVDIGSDMPVWPAFETRGHEVVSRFQSKGKRYDLAIGCEDTESFAEQLIVTLLQDLDMADRIPEGSYELVERTVVELHQAKEEADKVQARLNASLAQLQDAVVVADMAGRVVFENSKSIALLGRSFFGESVAVIGDALSLTEWDSLVRRVMLEREVVYEELNVSGELRMLCQAAVLNAMPGSLVFVFTDVSMLRRVEQSKNEALAFLSHDMRSPLVSMLSLFEKHRLERHDLIEPNAELMEQVEEYAKKSLKYSEDFLQLSRAENLDHRAFQFVDMHGVIDGAVAEVHGLAMRRDVTLTIERDESDAWVEGDAQLLERAVTNLLSNAVSYSPMGAEVIVRLQVGRVLTVQIQDFGPGIEQELLPHLFEPYFRVKNRGMTPKPTSQVGKSQYVKSYGLGLSFVDTVIRRHGGHITIDSVVGSGTVFTIELAPVDPA